MPKEIMKKIFLVEDDVAIIDVYQTMMKKAKFDVRVFNLGEEAIKSIKDIESGEGEKPDIILLDLILPDVDGMEVLKEIRNNNATKGVKVFILTNQENTESRFDDNVKPDKFIIKANITPTQLVELIKEELH